MNTTTKIVMSGRYNSTRTLLNGAVRLPSGDSLLIDAELSRPSDPLVELEKNWKLRGWVLREGHVIGINDDHVKVVILSGRIIAGGASGELTIELNMEYCITVEGQKLLQAKIDVLKKVPAWVEHFFNAMYGSGLNLNPLPIMRKLIPGVWTFERGERHATPEIMSKVFFNDIKVWMGRASNDDPNENVLHNPPPAGMGVFEEQTAGKLN